MSKIVYIHKFHMIIKLFIIKSIFFNKNNNLYIKNDYKHIITQIIIKK